MMCYLILNHVLNHFWNISFSKYGNLSYWLFYREGVGTSNFRPSTGQKFQNVEMVFLVDQNVESQKDQNVESDLPMAFCLLNLT